MSLKIYVKLYDLNSHLLYIENETMDLKEMLSLQTNMIPCLFAITHWGRVTHICVNKLTIIGSDNGLSPGRRQAIIWTNAVILLIGHLGTNFSEILIEIYSFSFQKMHLKMLSGKWRPSCLGLNVLSKIHVCQIKKTQMQQQQQYHTNPYPYVKLWTHQRSGVTRVHEWEHTCIHINMI